MAKWLALGIGENGHVRAAIVNDPDGTNLPHGDHGTIIHRLGDCEQLTALVELPDNFRPTVIDVGEEQEAGIAFVDL